MHVELYLHGKVFALGLHTDLYLCVFDVGTEVLQLRSLITEISLHLKVGPCLDHWLYVQLKDCVLPH